MSFRARVTLAGDPFGMHASPSAAVGREIAGFDAAIVFSQGDKRSTIDTAMAALSLLRAAAELDLACGSTFELTCDGPEAEEAFQALQAAFTQGHFAGSRFEVLD
jgi:phosphotransferase system HPr (HPr) family protein